MIVYCLTSPSGKRYIGQTIRTLARRWADHRSAADSGKHDWPLYRALRKYRPSQWTHRVIWVCETQEELDLMEAHFVEEFGDYNVKAGGSAGAHTQETKDRIGAAHRGKTVSAATRAKISAIRMGSKHTEESKAKMSEGMRKRAPYRHTDADKAKMGATRKGRKRSPEAIAKLVKTMTGKKRGPYKKRPKS